MRRPVEFASTADDDVVNSLPPHGHEVPTAEQFRAEWYPVIRQVLADEWDHLPDFPPNTPTAFARRWWAETPDSGPLKRFAVIATLGQNNTVIVFQIDINPLDEALDTIT